MFAASLLLLVPLPSGAQVAVEVIGHTGAMNAIADEGSLGSFVPFGGTIAVLPTSKIAVELDFQVGHIRQQRTAETASWRRLHLTPGIFYRWRAQQRTSVFFGGGLGLHEERIRLERPPGSPVPPNSTEVRPGVYNIALLKGSALSFRGGAAIRLNDQIFIRPEAGVWFANGPRITSGVRIGMGYRF